MRNHKIHVGQRVRDSDGIEGVVLSIEEYPFSKAVARVRYRSGELKPERFIYVDSLTPAPLDKPKPEPTVGPGDRVRDNTGKEGVVTHTSVKEGVVTHTSVFLEATPVANIRYDDGSLRRTVRSSTLTVLPKEKIKSGDKVQHTAKIDPLHRRTDGTAVGSILSNGTSISVLWPGGLLRTELLSQLEVAHSAKTENSSTAVEQALKLLGTEYSVTTAKIEELQAYKKSLGAAIDTLVGVVA